MNSYYLTLVLKPEMSEEARKKLLDEVEGKLKGSDGKVKVDLWGARDLAYPIKHQSRGFYAHFEAETEPQVASELDKILKVEEDIVRYLLVRVYTWHQEAGIE